MTEKKIGRKLAYMPKIILSGGYSNVNNDTHWEGYPVNQKIVPYYQPKGNGCLRIWQRNK